MDEFVRRLTATATQLIRSGTSKLALLHCNGAVRPTDGTCRRGAACHLFLLVRIIVSSIDIEHLESIGHGIQFLDWFQWFPARCSRDLGKWLGTLIRKVFDPHGIIRNSRLHAGACKCRLLNRIGANIRVTLRICDGYDNQIMDVVQVSSDPSFGQIRVYAADGEIARSSVGELRRHVRRKIELALTPSSVNLKRKVSGHIQQ